MTSDSRQMFRNSPKRQTSSDRMSKDSNNNPNRSHSQWFESSFNNKRIKISDQWSDSSGGISSVTRGINGLTTNSTGSQSMDTANEETEDPFNDDLDVYLTQTQFPIPTTSQRPQIQNRPNTSTNGMKPTVNGRQMANNSNDDLASEAISGRISILESQNKNLKEELTVLRSKNIVNNKNTAQLRRDSNRRLLELQARYEAEISRLKAETRTQYVMLDGLSGKPVKTSPNFMKNLKNCQSFSQIKLREFYGGVNCPSIASNTTLGSQMSTISGGDVLVPESQHILPSLNNSIPSEIPPTQMSSTSQMSTVIATTSSVESMDISPQNSSQTIVRAVKSSQNVTQSQSSKSFWDSIRPELENRFNRDREELNALSIGEQSHFIDDKWLRDTQDINDLVTTLNRLCVGLNIKTIDFD